jgi:tetratricopeptide (TPR) repeat protein
MANEARFIRADRVQTRWDFFDLEGLLPINHRARVVVSFVADALNSRGVALRDLNRPAEALASYEKALALAPDCAGAWFNRGSALRDLQHHAEALASYDTALRIKPDMAEAWVGRGLILDDHLDRPDEALAAYDKALSIKPDIAEAWLHRGGVLQKLKRPEEAVISYRQALANGGDAEVIQYTLASLGEGAAPAIVQSSSSPNCSISVPIDLMRSLSAH